MRRFTIPLILLMIIILAGCQQEAGRLRVPGFLMLLGGNLSEPISLPDGVAYTITLPQPLTERDAQRIQTILTLEDFTITGRLEDANETVITAYNPQRGLQATIRYTPSGRNVHVLLMKE